MDGISSINRVLILAHEKVQEAQKVVHSALVERGLEVRYCDPDRGRVVEELRSFRPEIVLLSGNICCDRSLLEQAQSVHCVLVTASGTETVDIEAATELGIAVGRGATEENTRSMAEAVVMLILTLLYDLRRSQMLARPGSERPDLAYARMLRGKTIGLIGYGAIARALVDLLSSWDVDFLAYSRSKKPDENAKVVFTDLRSLLGDSDIVSIHTSLNPESTNLIDAEMLGLMKSDAILINTARAGIVDEDALYRRLEDGLLCGVALDVMSTNAGPELDRWLAHPRAIISPHIVGHTTETFASLARVALASIERVCSGLPPLNIANPELLPDWNRRGRSV